MANITRKFREYTATAYDIADDGSGTPQLKEVFKCTYLANKPDERTAKKELKAAGYPAKPSTVVTVEPGPLHQFTATVDAFLTIAVDSIIEE